jgi:uncharacterized protein YegL
VADACREAENAKKVSVYPIFIPTSDESATAIDEAQSNLGRFSNKQALRLHGMNFKELFVWLSQSVRAVSKSATGEAAQLPSPAGWMVAETS